MILYKPTIHADALPHFCKKHHYFMGTMDYSKSIKRLREDKNLTVEELAKRLSIPSCEIDRAESGDDNLDEKTLEEIARYFGVQYDSLVNGTVKSGKKDTIFDPTEWYKLDNAAKVYPSSSSNEYSTLFRFAAVMKERVDGKILQQALDDLVPRFPTLMVTIKRGAFWYYFERLPFKPQVEKETLYSFQPIPLDGKRYLFRVVYSDYRIGCEFFHSITDGTGGSTFLMSLLARYYEIKTGKAISDFKSAKNYRDLPTATEIEDSFQVYAEKHDYAKRNINFTYIPKLPKARNGVMTHVITSASKLNQKAKEYGATITEYVLAIIFGIMFEMRKREGSKKDINARVPVNLRKFFPSDTIRNFSFFLDVTLKNEVEGGTQAYVNAVKECFKAQLNEKYLQENINANMREERNKFISFVPLALKDIGLKITKYLLDNKAVSMDFSNYGRLNPPQELFEIADRVEFCLKEPKGNGYKLAGVTFGDECVLTFSRTFKSAQLERDFVRALTNEGLDVYIETNGEK